MNNSKITFVTTRQDESLRTCCVLQEGDVCIATLPFIFISRAKYTKEDGTKVIVGKIVSDLYDLIISDSVKDKEEVVQRFISALQEWGDDTNVVSDIEVYLNHHEKYEEIIANEGFDKIPYKDACKYYWHEEANKTCYLTKRKSFPVDLNDSLFISFYKDEDSKE